MTLLSGRLPDLPHHFKSMLKGGVCPDLHPPNGGSCEAHVTLPSPVWVSLRAERLRGQPSPRFPPAPARPPEKSQGPPQVTGGQCCRTELPRPGGIGVLPRGSVATVPNTPVLSGLLPNP